MQSVDDDRSAAQRRQHTRTPDAKRSSATTLKEKIQKRKSEGKSARGKAKCRRALRVYRVINCAKSEQAAEVEEQEEEGEGGSETSGQNSALPNAVLFT